MAYIDTVKDSKGDTYLRVHLRLIPQKEQQAKDNGNTHIVEYNAWSPGNAKGIKVPEGYELIATGGVMLKPKKVDKARKVVTEPTF